MTFKTKTALIAVTASLFAAAASAQTLKIGLQEDPDTLDPALAQTYVSRIVFTALCDKLIDVNKSLEFVPQLATSWNWSADGKTLTFKLRKDVLFQDGTHFDAAAAKANLERDKSLQGSKRRSELASVESVDAPDADTLVIHTNRPDATLLATLSDRAGMMISPKTFDGTGAESVARHPVCTGPYEFDSRVQNDRIVLKKFDKYYDAKDYHFDRVVYLPIPDSTVRLQNLRSGGIDLLERLNPADIKQVKADPKLVFAPVTGLGFQQIFFNFNNGPKAKDNPFTNRLVREALQLTIDRDAINSVVGNGIFEPAQQMIPPASPYFNKDFPVIEPDIAKAKALLKEAGMPTVKADFSFGNNTVISSVAEMVQAMAAQAGIQLNLRPTDYAAMLAAETTGDFQIDLRGWSGRVDPDGNLSPFVTCKGSLNDGKYCNAKLDELLVKAGSTSDVAQRKALYAQAQTIIQHDLPEVNLFYQPWPFALRKEVHGFVAYPDGMIRLKGVTKEGT